MHGIRPTIVIVCGVDWWVCFEWGGLLQAALLTTFYGCNDSDLAC